MAKRPPTIIEIRPYLAGWQCFEAPGAASYWTGESAKRDALAYARPRAKLRRVEIRVLKVDGSIEQLIPFGENGYRFNERLW